MLDRHTQQIIDKHESEIGRLRRHMEQRPIYSLGGASGQRTYALKIIGGNTLSDAVTLGIKYVGAGIATVPSIYDPDVDTTFIDGIGRAWLYVDGVLQSARVLVVNDGRSGTLINKALFADDRCASFGNTTIPLTGDPTQSVIVYIPYFV